MDCNSSCPRDVRPPVATFSPSMWGDIFSMFSLDDQLQQKCAEDIEALRKEAKSMLMAEKSSKLMIFVDTLQRLGLAYHFETEIEEKLQEACNSGEDCQDYNLFTTALRFRLLRQHGYRVSCSVFDKFTEKNYKFKEALSNNVEGLLSLYEASHVRIQGENILEEALAFTTHHLTNLSPQLESHLKEKVKQAVERSIHRSVPIFHTRRYISLYENDDSRNGLLLQLAKLNFNFLQNLYKEDLCELSRWWKKFDLKSKLPYARDRLIECYLLGAAIRFEPQYSGVRMAVAKSLQLVTIIDDTYDNYATLEEAQLFTEILERWNMNEIDGLPDYMKIVYQFIMSTYEDYERDATKQGKPFAPPYFKEAVIQISRAYNQELKWVLQRQMPSFEEYITNSVVTSCIYMMFTPVVVGMKSANKETIDWLVRTDNKIVISAAKFGRHLEDLGSHERENKGGQMLTVVDCYMKQYGVSKPETLSQLMKLAEDAWKDLNTEWATATWINKEMVEQILNYARMAEFIYSNSEDGYTNPENSFAPQIVALFRDPISI